MAKVLFFTGVKAAWNVKLTFTRV